MVVFHVVYVSTAKERHSQETLLQLLNTARSRNEKLGLTGFLLYANERFMQVLEGRESCVREVFESILRDHRHTKVQRLRFEEREYRDFPEWKMGFLNLDNAGDDVNGFSRFLEPNFDVSAFQDSSSEPYRMLMAFRDAHEA